MSQNNKLLDELAQNMPKEFWDNLIVTPLGEQLPTIRIEDIVVE